MNREIKFRAWDKNINWNYQMFYGVTDISWDYKLMQYTWLKDKNWKEIYEGDIVNTSKEGYVTIYYEDWNYYAGVYQIAYLLWNNIEVIWNIYENSELIP